MNLSYEHHRPYLKRYFVVLAAYAAMMFVAFIVAGTW